MGEHTIQTDTGEFVVTTPDVPDGLPESVEQTLLDVADDLLNGSTVTVQTNPDDPATERDVTVDFVTNVDYAYTVHPEHDKIITVTVETTRSTGSYRGLLDSEGVFGTMERHGVQRPDGEPEFGVKYDGVNDTVRLTNFVQL